MSNEQQMAAYDDSSSGFGREFVSITDTDGMATAEYLASATGHTVSVQDGDGPQFWCAVCPTPGSLGNTASPFDVAVHDPKLLRRDFFRLMLDPVAADTATALYDDWTGTFSQLLQAAKGVALPPDTLPL